MAYIYLKKKSLKSFKLLLCHIQVYLIFQKQENNYSSAENIHFEF